MSNSGLGKEMVYLAYRDIFKDKLAKLRKRNKVRDVVEKHKDHVHHKQLTDSMDLEKTCRILGDLLAAGVFESELVAKVTFPTLFSPRELGTDTALIVKCVEDEAKCGEKDGTNPDRPPTPYSPDTPIRHGAYPGSSQAVGQHGTGRKPGHIRKPTRAMRKPTRVILEVEKGKEAAPKDKDKGRKTLKRTRGCDIIPTNPTYLPSRLQHLILTQTQRLLEDCCYNFAAKWFPSILEASGWDASEAVELTKWWKTLSRCDIPAAAVVLSHSQSLAVLFKRAICIRHSAVHRRPQIPVKEVEEMVRDAWLLSRALQDDLRAAQLLHWHKELGKIVAHLELRTNSQREIAEAELRNIYTAKVEIEERLAKLELRASQLTQSLEAEGKTHQQLDAEALRSLEKALGRPALAKALAITAQDQVWKWIENSVGLITNLKHVIVKVEPPDPGPPHQPVLRAPILASNAIHDSYESSSEYMGERGSLHKRRKCSREGDKIEQEVFPGSVQQHEFTTGSTTIRRTAIKEHKNLTLTPDMQTRAKNEAARHARHSAWKFQLSTPHPPDPDSTDSDNTSMDYGSVPADYEWK